MKCPKCQHENPDDAKFCIECASPMEFHCPNCGAITPVTGKFCKECAYDLRKPQEAPPIDFNQPQSYTPKFLADKILTTRSSIEGERKLVTVLFADVAKYTSMSEKLDPEEVHQIMDGCFQILMDEIHKYEGTINQFTGDGVMALFGAPVAHEDHAQRACYAALSVQRAMEDYADKVRKDFGVEFKMRIGLNSGHVIVGSIGDDLRMDYTAVGDTTNLASRMETMAKPGSILATGNIYRLARDFFEFEPLGEVKAKGKAGFQEAYELKNATEVESRIEAAAVRGLTKFVGRKREIGILREAFNKTQSGSGQVVGIVGEAGVGKSRLLLELRNILPKGKYIYLEGRCLHYGGSMPYLPILDILRSYFEIREGDREFLVKKKLKEKIIQLDERLKSVLPSFQDIFSLKIDDGAYLQLGPEQKKVRTFEAIRDLLVRQSEDKTIVLAVDDLHWVDKTSEEFLDYLIGWLANTHILLILLYRPEYTHQWGSKSYYSKIGVDQLSAITSTELVQAILRDGEVMPELRELVLDRAGGNPLFVEELTHSLVENGSIQRKNRQYVLTRKASEIEVPDTIQGIIAARLDRIEESLKRVMQVASVIGREFAFRVLQSIMEREAELKSSLLNLQGLEFISEKRLFPELEYIFKHALTQEVAYNSLLQKRRKEIHAKIGNAIESLYPERLEEYYELLAYHYGRSDNKDKALEYLDLANQKAAKLNAMEDARSYFDEAMKLLDKQPDTEVNRQRRITILANQLLVYALLFRLSDYYDLLTRYEHLAIDSGNQALLGRFFAAKCACEWWIGNYDQAIQTLAKASELCETSGAFEDAGISYNYLQWTHLCKGDFEQVFNFKEEALRTTEQQFNLRVYVWAFSAASWACTLLMRWDGAIENGKEALKVAEEFSDNSLISFAASSICLAYCFKGELDRAIEYGELAVQKAPTPADKIWAQGFLAMAWCRAGKLHPGIETLGKVIAVHKKGRFRFGEVGYTNMLGFGYLMAGEYDKARKTILESLELAESSGMGWFIGHAHVFLGQVALQTNPTHAVYHFEQSKISFEEVAADPSFVEFVHGITLLTKSNLRQGVKVLEDISEVFLKNGSVWNYVTTECILGNIYLQVVLGEGAKTLTFLAKNIAFLIKSFPRAPEKAEYHLDKAIGTAKEIGAISILGQAYLDLGLLHKAKKRKNQARECILKALEYFEQCEAEIYVKQAREALASLR